MGDGDLRTTLTTGGRLLCGWACIAVALLDLLMGAAATPYLVFHLVLLAGGLFLLGKSSPPSRYATATALALLTTVLAALPTTDEACCMRDLDVRHGYPLTVIGWNHGQQSHIGPAHVVADLVFWLLIWLMVFEGLRRSSRVLSRLSSRVLSRVLGRRLLPRPVLGGPSMPPAADNSAAPSTDAAVADDESVGGLP